MGVEVDGLWGIRDGVFRRVVGSEVIGLGGLGGKVKV